MNIFLRRHYQPANDRQLVEDLRANKEEAVEWLFYDHYRELLCFNARKVLYKYAGKEGERYAITVEDMIEELYLHLSAEGWKRLERYDPTL